MTLRLEMATATHRGMVRSHNEDCMVVDADAAFIVLTDGMGGHNAGEVASRIAAERVSASIRNSHSAAALDSQRAESLIAGHIAGANAAVFQAARDNPAYDGMGTTIVVVLWFGTQLSVGHVGDSRLYRLRQSSLERLTRDHSLVQEQLDRGAITAEHARYSANRNVLTRAVGIEPHVEATVHTHAVQREDLYLVCSDGLTDMLTEEEIRETLVACAADLAQGAQRLVEEANVKGGLDNISVALSRVAEVGA